MDATTLMIIMMLLLMLLLVGFKLMIYFYGRERQEQTDWGRAVDSNAIIWLVLNWSLMGLIAVFVWGFRVVTIQTFSGSYWFSLGGILMDSSSFDFLVTKLCNQNGKDIWTLSSEGIFALSLVVVDGWLSVCVSIFGLRRRLPSRGMFTLAIIGLIEMLVPAFILIVWVIAFDTKGLNRANVYILLTESLWIAIFISAIVMFNIFRRRRDVKKWSKIRETIEEEPIREEPIRVRPIKEKVEAPKNIYVILYNEMEKKGVYKCPYCDAEISASLKVCSVCKNKLN